jgi:hypothetical protein
MAVEAFERARLPTAAIYRDTRKGPDHEGSGVLLSIGDSRFLLTASHVCDAVARKESPFLLGTFGPRAPLVQLGQCAVIRSGAESVSSPEEWPVDVSVIELAQDTCALLPAETTFLALDDLDVAYRPSHAEFLMTIGCPSDSRWMRKDRAQKLVLPRYQELTGKPCDPSSARFRFPILGCHVAMEYSPVKWKALVGRKEPVLGKPVGMSGCGMWSLVGTDNPFTGWSARRMKLVGLFHTYREPVLVGTHVTQALYFIYAERPVLRPFLDKVHPVFGERLRLEEGRTAS